MGFFKKKKKVVDLGKRYREQQEMRNQAQQQNNQNTSGLSGFSNQANQQGQTNQTETNATSGFAMFDSPAAQNSGTSSSSASSNNNFVDLADTMEGRRKRLAKRIMEMTSKMENLSNQVYHLQQRIEVLERKLDVGRY